MRNYNSILLLSLRAFFACRRVSTLYIIMKRIFRSLYIIYNERKIGLNATLFLQTLRYARSDREKTWDSSIITYRSNCVTAYPALYDCHAERSEASIMQMPALAEQTYSKKTIPIPPNSSSKARRFSEQREQSQHYI